MRFGSDGNDELGQWASARLKDLSLEPRAVLATGCPLNHTIYCVHIIHRGHDACRLSGNQDDFTERLPRSGSRSRKVQGQPKH